MKKVILVCTDWRENYWEEPGEAPYPKTSYKDLKDWDELVELIKKHLLPGLGIYIKEKEDLEFVYLKIKNMRHDENEQPYFEVEPIEKAGVKSRILIEKLPQENKKLFSSIDSDTIIKILEEIGENPPEEWRKLLTLEKKNDITWRDWIGPYFRDLESTTLSSPDFEDRVADLLKALGFEVTQKGHRLIGAYCDGIAIFEDFAIVYDCKNRKDFSPLTDDFRALADYCEEEREVLKEKKIYCVFIAKSFSFKQKHPTYFCDFSYFSIESLIYLLYKKLSMGARFNLRPLKKILSKEKVLTIETIDNEWVY